MGGIYEWLKIINSNYSLIFNLIFESSAYVLWVKLNHCSFCSFTSFFFKLNFGWKSSERLIFYFKIDFRLQGNRRFDESALAEFKKINNQQYISNISVICWRKLFISNKLYNFSVQTKLTEKNWVWLKKSWWKICEYFSMKLSNPFKTSQDVLKIEYY